MVVAKLEAAVVAAVVAAVEVDAVVATLRNAGGKTRPPPPPRKRFEPSSCEGSLAGGWPRRIRGTALRRQVISGDIIAYQVRRKMRQRSGRINIVSEIGQ